MPVVIVIRAIRSQLQLLFKTIKRKSEFIPVGISRQTSQTLRKLVVRGVAAQPSRGMYARGAGVAEAVKEGSHAGESDQRQE